MEENAVVSCLFYSSLGLSKVHGLGEKKRSVTQSEIYKMKGTNEILTQRRTGPGTYCKTYQLFMVSEMLFFHFFSKLTLRKISCLFYSPLVLSVRYVSRSSRTQISLCGRGRTGYEISCVFTPEKGQ